MNEKINPFGNYFDYQKPEIGNIGGSEKVDKADEKSKDNKDDDAAKFGVAPQNQDETAQYTDMQIPEDDEITAGDFEDLTKKGMMNNGNFN